MDITVSQAAEELGVHRSRITALIKSGRLAAKQIHPRLLMIDRRALDAVRVRTVGRPKKLKNNSD